eukprot:scaffold7468_cov31-Prasinocladus_malaysianus.AAC.2
MPRAVCTECVSVRTRHDTSAETALSMGECIAGCHTLHNVLEAPPGWTVNKPVQRPGQPLELMFETLFGPLIITHACCLFYVSRSLVWPR